MVRKEGNAENVHVIWSDLRKSCDYRKENQQTKIVTAAKVGPTFLCTELVQGQTEGSSIQG